MASDLIDPYASGSPAVNQQPEVGGLVDPYSDAAPEPSAQPQPGQSPSVADYLRQAIGQGTAFGFGDEILGAMRGVYNAAVNGEPFEGVIDKYIDDERAINQRTEDHLGLAGTIALQAGGGLLSGGLGAARSLGASGLRLAPKLWGAAKTGLTQGAATGAGMAEGGVTDRLAGAAEGGAYGAVLGPAFAGGLHGLGVAKDAAARMLPQGAERQAKGLMQALIPQSAAQTMRQEMAEMPPPGVLADVAPRDAQTVIGAATRRVGGGQYADDLAARHRSQYERLQPVIGDLVSGKNANDVISDLGNARRTAANQQYGDIYATPLEMSGELKKLFDNPALADAFEEAQKIAGYAGKALPDGWDNAKLKPTVELADFLKQSLDDMVDEAFRAGKGSKGSVLRDVRDRLKDAVDTAVPDYKKARSTYAGYSASMEALEDGQRFMASTFGDEVGGLKGLLTAKDIAAMGEHQKEAFLTGVAATLRNKMGSKGFGADITKIFDTPNVHAKLNAVLGDDGASKLLKIIDQEAKMAATHAQNQGSQTARNLGADATMNAPFGVLQDAGLATAGHPGGYLNLTQRAVQAMQTPPEAVSSKLGGMMLTPDRQKQAAVLDMLSNPSAGARAQNILSRMLPPTAASLGGYTGGKMSERRGPTKPYILPTGQ
jgi:hypothetical protein